MACHKYSQVPQAIYCTRMEPLLAYSGSMDGAGQYPAVMHSSGFRYCTNTSTHYHEVTHSSSHRWTVACLYHNQRQVWAAPARSC